MSNLDGNYEDKFSCKRALISRSYHIMLTCPCNVDPLTPHFYIVNLGFTRVQIIFLFCSKTDCGSPK